MILYLILSELFEWPPKTVILKNAFVIIIIIWQCLLKYMTYNNIFVINIILLTMVFFFLVEEVCKKSLISGKTHVCKVLDDCKTAIQDIRDNVKYPTICSFKGKMPVVCCAPETVTREERLAIDEVIPEILPGITREYIIWYYIL